ncbi:gliding motility-associated C-terminal domain-containing protein [Flagellimonas sediminis]|uniref:Gliding motility-associated C-terminal domain-containing protein n=1 Tax=Flagellimonas sediminis TaxID=2696468 RepID=A0A6I5L3B0_9FLAO|nr:gliding motility-associated C-terminal domain-containing protein [Allomuricauda sediminis]NDV44618.1 gliding motility-associated C-terminal domain-containing protein [Allomuricauda sediminis]
MKSFLHISFLLVASFAMAQGLYNSGNLVVHASGNLGLHTNLINHATFDQTEGLVGFYGTNQLQVSGTVPATLWDMEIFVSDQIELVNTLNVRNNLNFISGDVSSPKDNPLVYLNFLDQGFFTGEDDTAKIIGFAAVNNRSFFAFPVGDRSLLRPLTLTSEGTAPLSICAYFFENPSSPSSLSTTFDVEQKVRNIGTVSDREFWIVDSDVPAKVTIGWNPRSGLGLIPNATAESVIVVGWNKAANQWTVIGNTAVSGDINQGFVTSETFVPSDYAAITFGTIPLPTDTFAVENPTLGNYFLSPNGDGINDFLIIDGLEESPNNLLSIYNRYGQKVFEKVNYTNDFRGMANTGTMILNQEQGLAEGVYFYLVSLLDLQLQYTGFIFLDR